MIGSCLFLLLRRRRDDNTKAFLFGPWCGHGDEVVGDDGVARDGYAMSTCSWGNFGASGYAASLIIVIWLSR